MKAWFALTCAAGAAATVGTAALFKMPPKDPLEIGAIGLGAALAGGIVGAFALRLARAHAIGVQTTIVALTIVGVIGGGAALAAKAMAFSTDDLDALLVILVAAGVTGILTAIALGHRIGTEARAIGEAARRIGTGDLSPRPTPADTGELGALARQLDAMTERLEEAGVRERALDTSRRELVAWVSHDIRTPLAGMRAMVEALVDGIVSDPETVARYHQTLGRETDRLSALVDDLFELSRIHAGALRLHVERISLRELVSDVIAAADPLAQSRGVRVHGRVPEDFDHIELSAPEFTRALRNILTNAIRHTPTDGTVSIEAGVDADGAFVSVADECGGIPEEDLPRVFDLAFRGERARTPGADGRAGLGLAIARGLIEAHNGEIVAANEGGGCRFTVRVPTARTA